MATSPFLCHPCFLCLAAPGGRLAPAPRGHALTPGATRAGRRGPVCTEHAAQRAPRPARSVQGPALRGGREGPRRLGPLAVTAKLGLWTVIPCLGGVGGYVFTHSTWGTLEEHEATGLESTAIERGARPSQSPREGTRCPIGPPLEALGWGNGSRAGGQWAGPLLWIPWLGQDRLKGPRLALGQGPLGRQPLALG